MTETVERRWHNLLARGEPETREVDADSPLRMLIGVSPVGRPYFVVISTRPVGLPYLPGAVEVTRRQRSSDGRWTLTLELQIRTLTDAFISLVGELATKSSAAANEEAALRVFLETLNEWQELLSWRNERLSEGALRGLLAELWFGFCSGVHGHSFADTTKAWVGPLGAAQDFQFLPPGFGYEVKSLRYSRKDVEISSAEQLDGENIRLAVVTLEEVEGGSGSDLTLPNLVNMIRAGLIEDPVRADFNRKIAKLQIDLDDHWYGEHAYTVRRLRLFEVRENFPALRRSTLPQAIDRVVYRLDTDQIAEFVIIDNTQGLDRVG